MKLGLKNKVALVTGSGRGIGQAIALGLAQEGCKVIVVSRTKKDVDSVIKQMGGVGKGHRGIVLDLVKPSAPWKLIQAIKKKTGFPDIVVHNLGGALDIRDPFCSMADWRKVYRLNFEVAVELNLYVLPEMIKKKWGRVIHISSIAGMENQGPVPYCSMKAALTAYTRSMGGVVAPEGVVVSAILPGAVFTKGGYWDITAKTRPDHVNKFLSERQRIGRLGRPEEIADLVVYLSSQRASFNTGSIIPVDGGQGRGYFGQ